MTMKNDALTPVVSAIVALLIVTSTMASVLLWGVPYIESVENTANQESTDRQFLSAAEAIDDLVNSNPGDKTITTLDLHGGSLTMDTDEKERTVLMYTFSDEYDFTVNWPETCFFAGTQVAMADGTYKSIEDITKGDHVLSYDKQTAELQPGKVTAVFHHTPEEMTPYYVIINNQLRVTPNHLFYANGQWITAGNLKIGDLLFDRERGMTIPVYALKNVFARETSFDLEIGQYHTYFVSMGTTIDVLVHNAGGGGGDPPSNPNPVEQYSQRDSYLHGAVGKKYTNYGDESYMWVDRNGLSTNRMVLWFWVVDLDIPQDAYIMSATLNIYYYDYYGSNNPKDRYYECWELATHFFEDQVCWQRPRNDADDWNGGADQIRTPVVDVIQLKDTGSSPYYYGWKEWDVTDSVQAFVNDDRNDYGWLIADQSEGGVTSWAPKFRSKEWSGTTYDPYLEISYVTDPECQTNQPTNVGETSVTLNGEVIDDGREPVQYRFRVNGAYYSWTGSKETGDTFSKVYNTDPGKSGWYEAHVRHSFRTAVVDVGEKVYFLTKPAPLTNLDVDVVNPGTMGLSWTNGEGGDGAYIEYAIGSQPSPWNVGSGTPVEEGIIDGYVSGESYIHNVTPDTTYYYKVWAVAEDGGYRSNGSDAFPFGDSAVVGPKTTPKIPTVTTHEATENLSTTVVFNGVLSNLAPNSDYDYCNVGFEYGPNDGYGSYIECDQGNPLTTNQPFSAFVEELTPGQTYHFRTVGEVDGYEFYGEDEIVKMDIDGIFIFSPGERYKWRRGTTQTITWAYEPILGEHTIDILWQRDGEEETITPVDGIPIGNEGTGNQGIYNWSIPLNQTIGYLNYTIKIISKEDPGVYEISKRFSIIELHEGIVYSDEIADPEGELGLSMLKGAVTKANIYWLDYGGELDPPTISGAVCIDLIDGTYWFGSIWIFDSDSILYEWFSSQGIHQKITIENGGIINAIGDEGQVYSSSPIFAGDGFLSVHVVQMIGSQVSAGGGNQFTIKISNDLHMNRIREQEHVYNLRVQCYGDNANTWIAYFSGKYDFKSESTNTLFYTPSSSKIWFAFAHSSVLINFKN